MNKRAVKVRVPMDKSVSVLRRKYLRILIAPNVECERREPPDPPDDVGELPLCDAFI